MSLHSIAWGDGSVHVMICDKCRGETLPCGTARLAIEEARDRGWRIGGGADLCPLCKPPERIKRTDAATVLFVAAVLAAVVAAIVLCFVIAAW